jgi:hypothetical protein
MPEPDYTTRTPYPAALPLQQAADTLRETPFYTRRLGKLTEPIAAWLDVTANSLAWLAPYSAHEPGYDMWQAASLVAETINGTAPTAPQPTVPPCRCGHDRARHGPDQCRDCPGDEERSWKHPYTASRPA